MKNYLKYILALLITIITSFLADGLIINLSISPGGTNTDLGFIETGITLIIGVIIGCTFLIIITIKNSNKSNK